MKKLWLYSVRAYLRIGLFFYFRRLYVYNLNNIPKNKPILFLSNHQNALLDALLIATKCGRFSYFLTRAAVFKKAFVSKILDSLQMLPVYRVRDGWSTIANNNAIFETCSELLYENESIVIFPEGSHNLKRTVRPLSKGFTRIVFDTLDKYPDTDLELVPVGLNFENAIKFPDSVSMHFGESISAKDFISDKRNNGVVNLKAKIQSEISKLTTHIPSDNYEKDLKTLEHLNINFLNPNEANNCLASNFKNCKAIKKAKIYRVRLLFKGLLILNILIPYLVWKFIAQPKIKEIEFVSTFRFAIAVTLVPFYLLVTGIILAAFFSFKIAIVYITLVLVTSLLAVKL